MRFYTCTDEPLVIPVIFKQIGHQALHFLPQPSTNNPISDPYILL